jgi:hypothetical protein
MDMIPRQIIENKIIEIRGQKIMIDSDIALLYGVETKVLNQAIKRNIERFPDDFMFQITDEELKILRSQNVTSSWGGRRTNPYAFTEQGIYMIATVLKSPKAIETNISIMRTFTKIRQHASNYIGLFQKIEKLENTHDLKFDLVAIELQKIYDILDDFIDSPIEDAKKMGFIK